MSQKLTKNSQALYLLDRPLASLNCEHHNSCPLVPDHVKAQRNNMQNNDDKNGVKDNKTFVIIKRDFQNVR